MIKTFQGWLHEKMPEEEDYHNDDANSPHLLADAPDVRVDCCYDTHRTCIVRPFFRVCPDWLDTRFAEASAQAIGLKMLQIIPCPLVISVSSPLLEISASWEKDVVPMRVAPVIEFVSFLGGVLKLLHDWKRLAVNGEQVVF